MRRSACLLPFLVLACATPVASAAAPFRFETAEVFGTDLDDGILGPGDSGDLYLKLTPQETFGDPGGTDKPTGLLANDPPEATNVTITNDTSDFLSAYGGTATSSDPGFPIQVSNTVTCGQQLPLQVTLKNTPTTDFPSGQVYEPLPFSLKTGVPGALRTHSGEDYGTFVPDRGSTSSSISVDSSGRVKHVRVTIKDLSHNFSLRWIRVTLTHGGKSVVLWERPGTEAKVMHNLVFDSRASQSAYDLVNGGDGIAGTSDDATAYSDTSITPLENPDDAFDGMSASGAWTLSVTDVSDGSVPRSGGRGRVAVRATQPGPANGSVGLLGDWSVGVAEGACDVDAPEAWFGPEPLEFAPTTGGTLDASVSADPGRPNGGAGEIVRYEWDLDGDGTYEYDGGSSPTVPLPSLGLGVHDVSLKVTDFDGNTGTHTASVIISNKPVISDATQTPDVPEIDSDTTFSVTVSDPDDPGDPSGAGQIASVDWDMDGDGTYERTGGPTNTTQTTQWSTQGAKVVRVRVTDGAGARAVYVFNPYIGNRDPIAAFSVINPVGGQPVAGQAATLSAAASVDPDGPTGKPVAYQWDFGDGAGYGDKQTTPEIEHVFPARGTVKVKLTVTDDKGATNEIEQTLTVTGAPVPQVAATPIAPLPGQVVSLDASASSDPDGHAITAYEWDLDNDGTFELSGASKVVTAAWPTAGVKVLRMRVTDSSNAQATGVFSVMVMNPLPAPPAPDPGLGGGTPLPDGSVANPDGSVSHPDGSVTNPDGTTKHPDGSVTGPDGKVIVPPGGSAGTLLSFDDLWLMDPSGDDSDEAEVNGFKVKIAASSKQKVKTAVKKGIKVKLTLSDPATGKIKPLIHPKYAKKIGIKPKTKKVTDDKKATKKATRLARKKTRRKKKTTVKELWTPVGLGRISADEDGTIKVVVKLSKKYKRNFKKVKKTPITLRAVLEREDGTAVTVSKKVYLVK